MGIVKKQSTQNTILSYLGSVLGMVNILILFPMFFTPEEFGLRSSITESALIMSTFCAFGFNAGLIKFLPRMDSNKEKGQFLSFVFIFPILSFLFLLTILFAFKSNIYNYYQPQSAIYIGFFNYAVVMGLVLTYFQLMLIVYSAMFKTVVVTFIQNIVTRAMVLVLAVLFGFHLLDLNQFWFSYILIYFLISIALFIGLRRMNIKFSLRSIVSMSKQQVKTILNYISFAFFGGILNNLILKIDVMMIGAELSQKVVALYGLAIFLVAFMELPLKSISNIMLPLISKKIKENKFGEIKSDIIKSSENLMLICGFIFCMIWVNLDVLFFFMKKGGFYQGCKVVFFILGLTRIIEMFFPFHNHVIGLSKKYKWGLVYAFIALIIVLVTNYYGIKYYGIVGAAVATSVSLIVYKSLFIISSHRVYKVVSVSTNQMKIVALITMTLAIYVVFPEFNNVFVNCLLKTLFLGGGYVLIAWKQNLSPDVKDMVGQIINKVRNK